MSVLCGLLLRLARVGVVVLERRSRAQQPTSAAAWPAPPVCSECGEPAPFVADVGDGETRCCQCVWIAGSLAATDGAIATEAPYPRGTPLYYAWLGGWYRANILWPDSCRSWREERGHPADVKAAQMVKAP